MPKRIPGLREAIVAAARDRLLRGGTDGFTMRDIAGDCDVGVATIYGYFPSKNMLLSQAILSDWSEMLDRAKARGQGLPAEDAVGCLYEGILAFRERYHAAWAQIDLRGDDAAEFRRGHMQLAEQLAAAVAGFLPDSEERGALAAFITASLLSHSRLGDCAYEQIRPFIRRLLV